MDDENKQKMLDILNNDIEIIPPEKKADARGARNLEADHDFAREKLRNTSELTTEAIKELIALATETQSPEIFATLAKLIDSSSKVNQTLLTVSEQKANVEKMKRENNGTNPALPAPNQTAIFVGSTKELLEKIGKEDIGSTDNS